MRETAPGKWTDGLPACLPACWRVCTLACMQRRLGLWRHARLLAARWQHAPRCAVWQALGHLLGLARRGGGQGRPGLSHMIMINERPRCQCACVHVYVHMCAAQDAPVTEAQLSRELREADERLGAAREEQDQAVRPRPRPGMATCTDMQRAAWAWDAAQTCWPPCKAWACMCVLMHGYALACATARMHVNTGNVLLPPFTGCRLA